MGEKVLMKGNEAIAEAAVRAGCRHYFGYPITPQNEIGNYMAVRMPEVGGVFIQAESEVAAINMVYGAASTGARVMTSSSGPGMSLKQEGISYIAGAEIPAVVVDIVRCGPGLGGILPAQSDYFQAVKGGGHGDFKNFVIAPASVQEMYEMTVEAFNIAEKYKICVLIMADGVLGQMMESVEFREKEPINPTDLSWAVRGTEMKRSKNVVSSIFIEAEELEGHIKKLQAKYRQIENSEVRFETYECEDADIIIAAYGTSARIANNVVKTARADGLKVGVFRPITLWPFPEKVIGEYALKTKAFLTVEMSEGQMVEDVRLAVNGKVPVHFYGRNGGIIPKQAEIYDKIKSILKEM